MKRISLLLPTRGRAKLVERFLSSVIAQSAHPESVEVVICVDDDDLDSHRFVANDLALKLIIVPRQTMGAYNAICLQHASGQITVAVNDDVIIRTHGWDDRVRALDARFPDGIYLGYGNDLFKGSKLCTFPILSRETCERLAEPYPAVYRGAFLDTHLMDIFNRLKHRGHDRFAYDKDLIFEHIHYRTNPAAFDATYAERERFGDDPKFIALVENRRLEADRLLAAISGGLPTAIPQDPPTQAEPAGPIGIIHLCARKFLLDFDLPVTWRCYLFAWMIARRYYSRLRDIGSRISIPPGRTKNITRGR